MLPRWGAAGPWAAATVYGIMLGLFMYGRFATRADGGGFDWARRLRTRNAIPIHWLNAVVSGPLSVVTTARVQRTTDNGPLTCN